ncbi:MAG: 5-formyltetrahydrofolate cyclo-ligase [Pseudomonadota bacterium]
MALSEQKEKMRALSRARRQAASRAAGDIGPVLVEGFASWADGGLAGGSVIAGYHPIRDEADCLPVLAWARDHGFGTCLPVTQGSERPLLFRTWTVGEPLVAGGFGVQEPSEQCRQAHPDLLLIPLLAFDLTGGRLGYGAGHYDRTLAGMADRQPVKIGVAFSGQEVDQVPMGPTDQPLDGILTENGLKWIAPVGAGTAFA